METSHSGGIDARSSAIDVRKVLPRHQHVDVNLRRSPETACGHETLAYAATPPPPLSVGCLMRRVSKGESGRGKTQRRRRGALRSSDLPELV